MWDNNLILPVIASPMFLVSGPKLVTACCESGIIGTFPALNQRTFQGLEDWLIEIKTELTNYAQTNGKTPAPFGVNLIVHKSNPRLEADLEICIRHQVPLIITSLGAVADLVQKVHSYGGLVFHDVTTIKHARKAAEAGVDGLILVSAGAGGHAGTLNPFAFYHEVREFFDKKIILAGALSHGSDIAAARVLGADYVYMGTRFLATTESMASAAYKDMVVNSEAADIIYTPAISSIPASFLKDSIIAAGMDPEKLVAPDKIDLTHVTLPHQTEKSTSKAWKDIWSAGQGVGGIHDAPTVAELVTRLKAEYTAALQRR